MPRARGLHRLNMVIRNRLIGFALGALAFLAAHGVEIAMWSTAFGGEHEPWFLNSGTAVAFTLACVFVAGAAGGALGLPGLAVAAGSFVALTTVLFVKEGGPGTIFPIVMTVGDVRAVRAATDGRVVVVHLEAMNHCLERREDYRTIDGVLVPDDGETID